MPQILKVKNADILVVALTEPNKYGVALYKVIKQNGITNKGHVTKNYHINDLEDARKPRTPPVRPAAPPYPGCPSCGTHPRMGYVPGVACPNCEEGVVTFDVWLHEAQDIQSIAQKAHLDIADYRINQIRKGMKVELEHGKKNPKTDVTHNDPIKTLKIVLAHLNELPDYYDKLEKVEKNADAER